MKPKTLSVPILIFLSGFFYYPAFAQDDVNIWAKDPITVDGNSSEWHEPLNNYNSDTKLAFALANDQDNIYLIIESLDVETTKKLLTGGLTLTVNTSGKKKEGLKLVFLGMNNGPHPGGPHPQGRDSIAALKRARDDDGGGMPGLKMIQVSGFKSIPAGGLPIPNQQGIQVAAAFNKQRDYICELAIPMALLDFNGKAPKAIAYNIKINSGGGPGKRDMEGGHRPHEGGGMGGGQKPPGGGGGGHGMGGHGGGDGMGGSERTETKAADFWIKYELAKPSATFRAN